MSRCQYRRLRHRDVVPDLRRLVADLTDADPSLARALRRRIAAGQRPAEQRRPVPPVRRVVMPRRRVAAACACGGASPAETALAPAPDPVEFAWAGDAVLLEFAVAAGVARTAGGAALRWSWLAGLLAFATTLAAAALAVRGRPEHAG